MKTIENCGFEVTGEYQAGIESVLYIRCVEHREIGRYNENEISGGECPACTIIPLQQRIAELEAERDSLLSLLSSVGSALPPAGEIQRVMASNEKLRAACEHFDSAIGKIAAERDTLKATLARAVAVIEKGVRHGDLYVRAIDFLEEHRK